LSSVAFYSPTRQPMIIYKLHAPPPAARLCHPRQLQGAHLPENGVLLSGHDDLLIVGEDKCDAGTIEKTRLFDVGKIDEAIASRTEERGAVQPAFAFAQRSPDSRSSFRHHDARSAAACFKHPDVCRPDQPALSFATEEDEVVRTKDAFILFSRRVAQFVLFQLIKSLCCGRRSFHRGAFRTTFRDESA
jgi:hypothetical protein